MSLLTRLPTLTTNQELKKYNSFKCLRLFNIHIHLKGPNPFFGIQIDYFDREKFCRLSKKFQNNWPMLIDLNGIGLLYRILEWMIPPSNRRNNNRQVLIATSSLVSNMSVSFRFCGRAWCFRHRSTTPNSRNCYQGNYYQNINFYVFHKIRF